MRMLCLVLLGTALIVPFASGVSAQLTMWNQHPNYVGERTSVEGDYTGPDSKAGPFVIPTRTAEYNSMQVEIGFVEWSDGAVDIPITINQRARVWVAIYQPHSSATGPSGHNDAIMRLAPGPMFVALTEETIVEAGPTTIAWDGNDWQGNPASGDLIFDVIALNDLDDHMIAGPSQAWAWGPFSVDAELGETWAQFTESPPNQAYWGDLENDWVANPGAWEIWNITGFDDSDQNVSANIPDDLNPTVHWTSRGKDNEETGKKGGIMRLTRNEAAMTLEHDEAWGVDGVSPLLGDTRELEPVGNRIIVTNPSVDHQRTHIVVLAKTTGELLDEWELFEWTHTIEMNEDESLRIDYDGPWGLDANEGGIFITHWQNPNKVFMDLNGNIKWVNGIGDGHGEWASIEWAAEMGLTTGGVGSHGVTVGQSLHPSGKVMAYSDQGNGAGYNFGLLGRDGTGLFHHTFDPTKGPWYALGTSSKHLEFVSERTKYDGLYVGVGVHPETGELATDIPEGPASLIYFPFNVFTGSIGSTPTAIEEVEEAATPDAYELGDGYPNPFNATTTIEFKVSRNGHVKLEVYNMSGQLVASLVNQELRAGSYRTEWDARDLQGAEVSSGTYIYRMTAGTFVENRKLTLLK